MQAILAGAISVYTVTITARYFRLRYHIIPFANVGPAAFSPVEEEAQTAAQTARKRTQPVKQVILRAFMI